MSKCCRPETAEHKGVRFTSSMWLSTVTISEHQLPGCSHSPRAGCVLTPNKLLKGSDGNGPRPSSSGGPQLCWFVPHQSETAAFNQVQKRATVAFFQNLTGFERRKKKHAFGFASLTKIGKYNQAIRLMVFFFPSANHTKQNQHCFSKASFKINAIHL